MFGARRFGLYLLLCPVPLLAQVANNSLTVTASQNAAAQPDEVVFSVVVGSGLDQTLDNITSAVSTLGLTAVNLASLGTSGASVNPGQRNNPYQVQWTFQLVVPFSKMKDTTAALASLRKTIGTTTAGLSLSYSVAGTQVSPQSSNCNLANLVAQARTEAQQIASAASVKPGAMVGLASSTAACALTASFALGAVQPGPGSIIITATRPNPTPPDQVLIAIYITSAVTATLDEITGALTAAGVTGTTFASADTQYVAQQFILQQTALSWTFTETIPLASLKNTLSQLAAAGRGIVKLSTGLRLTFAPGAVSFSQPPSCPDMDLLSDAKAEAQQLAAAAGVSAGSILSMSGAGSAAAPAFVQGIVGGSISSITPLPVQSPTCTLTAQFQLL